MIHIAWPWMLLCLPLPWWVARRLPTARVHGAALFLPFAAQVAEGAAPAAAQVARWRWRLFVVIWALLLAAAVRPQWLGEPQPAETTGRRLLLAVDVSGSMATPGMAGDATRLHVVKEVAGEFIRRRHGDQVGLILFGTRPYPQAPLSADLDTVNLFLQEASIGIAGLETAVGDAIGMALKRLRTEPGRDAGGSSGSDRASENRRTVLVLLTDGTSNAGEMPPLPAAKLAAASGLRIYTIGVGAGADSDLDADTLQAIARETGGAYFHAADAAALQQAYAQMDLLEPASGPERWVRPRDEWFTWPLALALLLSVPTAAIRGAGWR